MLTYIIPSVRNSNIQVSTFDNSRFSKDMFLLLLVYRGASAKAESFDIAWWTIQSPTKIERHGKAG